MKLLLDEMVTPRLGSLLTGHEVSHVASLGWRHIGNGKLLALAESEGFAAMITKDSGMPFQQNLTGRRISLIVLLPRDQTRLAVLDMAPVILRVLPSVEPGSIYTLGS